MDLESSTDHGQGLRAPSGRGPGLALQEGREAARLSLQQVADELRLRPWVIEALEADDYEALPEPTYVKGYIRSYGRLLGLDGDALVERYRAVQPAQQARETGLSSSSRQRPEGAVWLALVAVVAAIVAGGWWWTREVAGPVSQPEEGAGPAGQAARATAGEPGSPSGSGAAETGAANVARDAGAQTPDPDTPSMPPTLDLAGSRIEPDLTRQAESNSDAPSPAPGTSEANQQGRGAESVEREGPATGQSVSGDGASGDASAGTDTLLVSFSEKSWVEVRDATGERLLYGLLGPSAERRLTGEGPFEVFLGNAPGVEIRVNGEPFDPGPYAEANRTARFNVP